MVGGLNTQRGWLREGVIWGSMLGKTILPTDEELGKKDDDHKRGASRKPPIWNPSKTPLRWRRRRILLAVVGLYLVYLVFKNVSYFSTLSTTLGAYRQQPVAVLGGEDNEGINGEPKGPPPGLKAPKNGNPTPREYNGQIKFYRLATSLHGASTTQGYRQLNRNVLFAVSNPKSVSTLLPMICEMSIWSRNYVHVAFMGRDDIPVDDLLEINGIDKPKCPVFWHDARPDYTEYSSDARAESSVMAALTHIQHYLHPQAVIVDDALSEDAFFTKGLGQKAKKLELPIIEIPKGHWENFMWITRLDAGSLRSWHYPTVDILIQAPAEASGGLVRLLKSLRTADYKGMAPPRLTIEVPATVDPWVNEYIDRFVWPPESDEDTRQITIRRRISSLHSNQEDSSVRFLELFYPSTDRHSHVLVLSPNAELSPLYYHYLKYVLLEYRYSTYGEDEGVNIMGISLELPTTLLDGKTKLKQPKPADMNSNRYKDLFPDAPGAQFLWQAPNSHATLYFGEKWAELHSFLSNRVAKQHQAPKTAARPKIISETLPAWMEYMLEFMRARGYGIFYPVTSGSESFVTLHHELYHRPEEFAPKPSAKTEKDTEGPPTLPDEPFLRADTPPPKPTDAEPEVMPYSRPLHLALPFEGDLPEVSHLPHLLYDGEPIRPLQVSNIANEYSIHFRETVGECKIPKGKRRIVEQGNAKDLFCFGDEDDDDWEDVDPPASVPQDAVDSSVSSSIINSIIAGPTPTPERKKIEESESNF